MIVIKRQGYERNKKLKEMLRLKKKNTSICERPVWAMPQTLWEPALLLLLGLALGRACRVLTFDPIMVMVRFVCSFDSQASTRSTIQRTVHSCSSSKSCPSSRAPTKLNETDAFTCSSQVLSGFQALKRTGFWKWLLLVWGFFFPSLRQGLSNVALAVLEFI